MQSLKKCSMFNLFQQRFYVLMRLYMHPNIFVFFPHVCLRACTCAHDVIKEGNSLVDRNCNGLEVKPLAAVMQVKPHKPHQSKQQHNEAELLNGVMPATRKLLLLLLPQQRQAQLRWQHAEGQADSIRQSWRTGTGSSRSGVKQRIVQAIISNYFFKI